MPAATGFDLLERLDRVNSWDAPIRPGAPMIFIVREILEEAKTLEDARSILDRRRGFVSEGILVVDGKAGEGAIFEVTPDDVSMTPAGESIALSNHFRGAAHKDDQPKRYALA